MRFAEVSFRNYLVTWGCWGYMTSIGIRIIFIWVMYICIAGLVASRAQWRYGIFTVGLHMAIKLNQVKVTVRKPQLGATIPRATLTRCRCQLSVFVSTLRQVAGRALVMTHSWIQTTFSSHQITKYFLSCLSHSQRLALSVSSRL